MSKLLVAAVAVSAIAAFGLAAQPAQARHCSLVKATTQGSAHLVKPLRWFAARSREFKDWAQRKGETP